MIKSVTAREIIDSRGNPTVETQIETPYGVFLGAAPSGASTGSNEAFELRDGGKRFQGRGVLKAVGNVKNIIAPKLVGQDASEQGHLDSLLVGLDGTRNKRKLGGNAIVSVSIALCKAGAAQKGRVTYEHVSKLAGTLPSLPIPFSNLINGGKHAGIKNDFQEHMAAPVKAKNFAEALETIVSIFHSLSGLLRKKGINSNLVADEGGFVFGREPEERLSLLWKAVGEAGVENKVCLALDCAATEYEHGGKYLIGGKGMNPKAASKFYGQLVSQFKLFCIEDPFSEEDWLAWRNFTSANKKLQVVGDDLLATNPERIRKAVALKACNALLMKPNQIGTVSEAIEAFKLAKQAGWKTMVSHRSGETEDSFISHMVVGLGCGQCKFGAPNRGERTAKYNELLRISEKVKKFGVV